jgi:hypothetical protein
MKTTWLLPAAAALAAVALSACDPLGSPAAASAGTSTPAAPAAATGMTASGTTAVPQGTASAGGSVTGTSTGPGAYIMQAMAAGTVTFKTDAGGGTEAQLTMFGLTPGSTHQVSADSPAGSPVQFPALTAGPGGQASATLIPDTGAATLPPQSRIVIRLGDASSDPLAREPIAESPVLPAHPQPGSSYTLQAVDDTQEGTSYGQPAGYAQLSYDAAAQTLTVTLTASGLTPGAHAAHIHLGSCRDQGPVKYMLADFTADQQGNIADQSRVVTGVASAPGSGWYLNLHKGGMTQILSAAGTPTLYFRPLLCTDITTFAAGSGSATPSAMTAAPAASMPASTSSASAMVPDGSSSAPAPATTPSAAPSYAGPTHF